MDVYDIAIETVRLGGASPIATWAGHGFIRDVGTPFEPRIGKKDSKDCTKAGRDGFNDLILVFRGPEILEHLGPLSERDVVVVPLVGELVDGTRIRGEDVVLIHSAGRKKKR